MELWVEWKCKTCDNVNVPSSPLLEHLGSKAVFHQLFDTCANCLEHRTLVWTCPKCRTAHNLARSERTLLKKAVRETQDPQLYLVPCTNCSDLVNVLASAWHDNDCCDSPTDMDTKQ